MKTNILLHLLSVVTVLAFISGCSLWPMRDYDKPYQYVLYKGGPETITKWGLKQTDPYKRKDAADALIDLISSNCSTTSERAFNCYVRYVKHVEAQPYYHIVGTWTSGELMTATDEIRWYYQRIGGAYVDFKRNSDYAKYAPIFAKLYFAIRPDPKNAEYMKLWLEDVKGIEPPPNHSDQ